MPLGYASLGEFLWPSHFASCGDMRDGSHVRIGSVLVYCFTETNWARINLMRVMDAMNKTLADVSSVSPSSFALANG